MANEILLQNAIYGKMGNALQIKQVNIFLNKNQLTIDINWRNRNALLPQSWFRLVGFNFVVFDAAKKRRKTTEMEI